MVLKIQKSMKTVLLSMIGLLMAVSAIAQTGQTNVKGTVRDVNGEPIMEPQFFYRELPSERPRTWMAISHFKLRQWCT